MAELWRTIIQHGSSMRNTDDFQNSNNFVLDRIPKPKQS
jgi:hypothetical protein